MTDPILSAVIQRLFANGTLNLADCHAMARQLVDEGEPDAATQIKALAVMSTDDPAEARRQQFVVLPTIRSDGGNDAA